MHYNVGWTGLCVRGSGDSDDVASHCTPVGKNSCGEICTGAEVNMIKTREVMSQDWIKETVDTISHGQSFFFLLSTLCS